MLLTPDEPPFRNTPILRFWHTQTEELYHNVANLNLLEMTITVEHDNFKNNPFDEDSLQTFPIEDGHIDNSTFTQDLNEKTIYQNDIVAIWFVQKLQDN